MFKAAKNFLAKYKNWILAFALLLLTASFIYMKVTDSQAGHIEKISYNTFMEYVENNEVDTVYYNKSNEWMTLTLFNEDTKNMSIQDRLDYTGYTNEDKRLVLYPANENFRESLMEHDILLNIVNENTTFDVVMSRVMTIAFPILWIIILLVMLKNTIYTDINKDEVIQTSEVKFDDVIGHDEIIDDLKFITKLMKNPKLGNKVGTQVPKGILFSGPPGCGKTLLAKAIAGEADVPFLYQNASRFIDRFVGVGAKHVRDLFKLAKQNAPCIIFIDEIDAVGTDRDNGKGTSEHEQTIDALLQEMDGFTGREGIFVIAATNRPDTLDKALVRAGRFDRQIIVAPPRNWQERYDLFVHHLDKFAVSDELESDLEEISKQVSGFTGADIAAICNEASIIAVMQEKDAIDRACIEEAIDKKIFKGNRAKKEKFIKDKEIVAYHEAGHAVMSYFLGEPIARASIQSTVSGVGGAVFNADKETVFKTKQDFEHEILICYAGRASEEIKFESVTTGASNDITQATTYMTQYIENLGFDNDFGLLDISVLGKTHLVDGRELTKRLSTMSKEMYERCKTVLEGHYDMVEKLATKLLEVETLSGKEIEKLFNE